MVGAPLPDRLRPRRDPRRRAKAGAHGLAEAPLIITARLGAADGAALLGIARGALRHRLGDGPVATLPTSGPLTERRGAFVTIMTRDELRGCVGTFTPDGSLASTVARLAVSAATEDPRFAPLQATELDDVDLHISVLDPCRRMREPSELEIGRDGVLVKLGWHRGTLLPRVAVEAQWGAVTFLQRTCLKAGLPPDAWQDPAAVVELFSTEELG